MTEIIERDEVSADDTLQKVKDICVKFKVSRPTVYNWIEKGILPKPTKKVGGTPYWTKSSLDKVINDESEVN